MRLALFGGTFDPPHLGHLVIAEYARAELGLDKVLFIPAGQNPLKDSTSHTSGVNRMEMTRLAIADNVQFEASDIELIREGPSYSIDTIRQIRQTIAPEALFLLVGFDNLELFPRWHKIEDVVQESRVIVCNRVGTQAQLPASLLNKVTILDSPLIELSSTMIRERVQKKQSIRYMVPETVRAYIESHNLYR